MREMGFWGVSQNRQIYTTSRKFSKLVGNTVGKGEIARYEQFLLFSQCFQQACFPGASKGVVVWEWLKVALNPNTTNQVRQWQTNY